MHSHWYTTAGGGRPVNEDCVITRRHPQSSNAFLCFLADGQGGRAFGAEAARCSCETACDLAIESNVARLFEPWGWNSLMSETDAATMGTRGFTTLIALAVQAGRISGSSSGDSKAYFATEQDPEPFELTARQSRNPPVGSGECAFVPFTHEFSSAGRLLLLSDGVWKYCGYEAIRLAFQSPNPDSIHADLKAAVHQSNGPTLPDDFSVIVVDVAGSNSKHF